MSKTSLISKALLVALALGGAAPAAAAGKVLKISNGLNEQHPTYLAGKKFGELLAAKLPGKYDVQVYANAQLGDDVRATEAVRMGSLEMVATSASPLTGLVPEFSIFDLPFIITSEAAADAVYDGPVGERLAKALEAKGLVHKLKDGVKVLGAGELKKALTLKVHKVSETAKAAIEKAGGKIELIAEKQLALPKRGEGVRNRLAKEKAARRAAAAAKKK